MSAKKTSNAKRRNAANTVIISSLAYLVLGFIMVIFPTSTKDFLCLTMGIVLTIYGVFNIISFFSDKQNKAMYFELIVGVLSAALGLFSLVSPSSIIDFIMAVIGVLVVVDSLMDIKHSLDLKKLGMKYWWVYTALSTAVIILGLCTIFFADFFESALIVLLGVILIYEGISGLSVTAMISHYAKKSANLTVIETTAADK